MWEEALAVACHDADALHRTLRASELKPGWVVVMSDDPSVEYEVHRIDHNHTGWLCMKFIGGKYYAFRIGHHTDDELWERVR